MSSIGIGVEERIERRRSASSRWPVVARGPAVDLPDIFHHQRVAKFLAQADTPQSDHRMRLSAGGGDRELRVLSARADAAAPPDRAAGTDNPPPRSGPRRHVGPVRRGPVERGEDARERSRKILHGVGDDGQSEARKPRGIAIGVENQPVALRLEPRDHALEDGAAADLPHRLVAAAHPPRQAAGEQHAVGGISFVTVFALALVPRGFFFDKGEVLVVDDALVARQRDEALAPRAPDQRQSDLPRQVDAPGGKA